MIQKEDYLSWEEYFIRYFSSQSIVQVVLDLIEEQEFSKAVTVKLDTGDLLFEIDKI